MASLDYCRKNFPSIRIYAPQLPYYPKDSQNFLRDLCKGLNPLESIIIASSMGAYLLSSIEESFHAKACLINPAVSIEKSFLKYLGENTHPYTKEKFWLTEAHLNELSDLERNTAIHPENHFVLLKTGDEVLDYKKAVAKYAGAKFKIDEGGDHSFSDFQENLGTMFNWLCSVGHL